MTNTNNGHAATRTRKILFVTNPESGQANTILAMAHEASTRPHIEVHIASFAIFERRVKSLSPRLNFHLLNGKDMVQVLTAQGFSERELPHPPTTKSFAAYGKILWSMLTAWDGECTSCVSS
jgi:hypothetical protein